MASLRLLWLVGDRIRTTQLCQTLGVYLRLGIRHMPRKAMSTIPIAVPPPNGLEDAAARTIQRIARLSKQE